VLEISVSLRDPLDEDELRSFAERVVQRVQDREKKTLPR